MILWESYSHMSAYRNSKHLFLIIAQEQHVAVRTDLFLLEDSHFLVVSIYSSEEVLLVWFRAKCSGDLNHSVHVPLQLKSAGLSRNFPYFLIQLAWSDRVLGFGVWGLGFGVWGLGFG